MYLCKVFDKISHRVLGDKTEKNEQNAALIWGLKHTKISGTSEWIMRAWSLFSSDVPESFIFGLTLVNIHNINFIQNYTTHGHRLRDDTKQGRITNARSGQN